MATEKAPVMAVHKRGSGPNVVLFHGGMGCWQHWARNVGPLSEHFTVYALDHPSYGASAMIPRETTCEEYLDLMHELIVDMFPGEAELRLAGFSFGGAIAANLARRLGDRVSHLCLISPAGYPPSDYTGRPTRSYKEAGDNEELFREICQHNLLVNMLSSLESISEETLDIQAYCVRHTRYNSRKVSGGGTLLNDLAEITSRLRILWGEGDDKPYRLANEMIGQIRDVVGDLDVHRIPKAGHWAAYENSPEVNRLMVDFFTI